MSKIVKKIQSIAKKKTKKELEEELALRDQTMDILAEADTAPIAVDTASLSHSALAETVALGAAVATDVAVAGTAVTTTAAVAAVTIPTWAYVAGGAVAIGGIAAAAGGGGGSSAGTPTTPTPPTDTTAPVFTSSSTTTPIAENSAAGQVVYTAVATDNVKVTSYTLGGADASKFTIDSTGKVTLIANPDFETKSSYNFSVIAKDAAGNSATKAVTLGVSDLDDRPRTGYAKFGFTPSNYDFHDVAYDLEIDSSGNIYLGGAAETSNNVYDFALAKLTSKGELDTTFGDGDGKVTTDFGSGKNDYAYDMKLDAGGNIYLAGKTYKPNATSDDFALAKYTSNGELDKSFGGGDGMVATDINRYDSASAIELDSSGNIYLSGESSVIVASVAKYTPSGDISTSFGGVGTLIHDPFYGEGVNTANDIKLDASGNIYLAGSAYGYEQAFALTKLTPDGKLDTSFGNGDGSVNTTLGGYNAGYATSMEFDANGNIYVAGCLTDGGDHTDFALVKYTSNGELDKSFGGGDGVVTTHIDGDFSDIAYDLKIDATGSIYLAGESGNFDFALTKYTSNGELDKSFGGGDGIVTNRFFDSISTARSMELDSSGNIYLAGSAGAYSTFQDFMLVKYTSSGILDTTFGTVI